MVLCLPFLVELEFGNVGFQGEAGCKESQFYSLPCIFSLKVISTSLPKNLMSSIDYSSSLI